jgi:hypothetical protein
MERPSKLGAEEWPLEIANFTPESEGAHVHKHLKELGKALILYDPV